MEPISATVIATLIATKAIEKTGEMIGEGIWNQAGNQVRRFLTALRRQDPETAGAIEQVAQNPALAEQQPQTYGTEVLIAKVESAAQQDAVVRQVVQEIRTAVQAQPGAIVNLTQLAEKIGVVNQGTIVNQTNTISL